MKYAVVIESSEPGFSAYVPDLSGCVAVGESIRETENLIREAIVLHLEGLREDGEKIPSATTRANYVDIA